MSDIYDDQDREWYIAKIAKLQKFAFKLYEDCYAGDRKYLESDFQKALEEYE